MENLILRLRHSLRQQPAFKPSGPLERLFAPLEHLTTEQLLVQPELAEPVYHQIRKVIMGWRYYRSDSGQRQYLLLRALRAARQFLYQAAGSGSLRYTIYFLYAAVSLGITPAEAIEYFGLPRTKVHQLGRLLGRVLRATYITPTAAPDAPAHEQALLQRAAEGYAQGQLAAAYELLEALEHSRLGIHAAFPMSGLLTLLAATDYTQFLQTLQQQTSPFSWAVYLQDQPTRLLERLSQDGTVRSPWLLVEVLRSLVATERRGEEAAPATQVSALQLLTRLRAVDFVFFQQAVTYFQRSLLVNTALGKLLATWSVGEALTLLQTCLSINQYTTSQPQRSALLLAYSQHVERDKLVALLAGSFAAWESYLDEINHSKTASLFSVLHTDYWDYVCNYYAFTHDEAQLVTALTDAYAQIRWHTSEWHANNLHFIRSYYLKLTKLFALSRAYALLELHIPAVQQLAAAIEIDLTCAAIARHDEKDFAELLTNLRS
jgi:hypothetical protein